MILKFERGALIAVAGLIAGLFLLVLLSPLDRETSSPKASLRLAVSQPVPEKTVPNTADAVPASGGIVAKAAKAVADFVAEVTAQIVPPKPKMAGIDTLTGAFSTNAQEGRLKAQPLKSEGSLSETFNKLGYDLNRVGAGEAEVPRLFLARLPGSLGKIREAQVRKSIFFKTVLPLVLQANEEILRDRRRLWNIHYQQSLGQKTGAADRLWLEMMKERYGVKKGGIETLLKRVDVIPPSLALAQAAEESGWGTSRFVIEGNAVFGQWTFSDTKSLVPNGRDKDKLHKIKAFPRLIDSVRSYIYNLNTHAAYRQMRQVRHSLRIMGAPLEGLMLAENIERYSQRGEEYVDTIKTLIESNKLHRLDDARLREASLAPRSFI
jgi:Bax protein